MSTYMLGGFCAAIGGIIIAGRLGRGSSNAGVMFELEVIAAVVLGGTNLFGGRGTKKLLQEKFQKYLKKFKSPDLNFN